MVRGRDDPRELNWFKCPQCSYVTSLYRQRTDDYVCRHCGIVFKVNWLTHEVSVVKPTGRKK